jgi:hypothetical protein
MHLFTSPYNYCWQVVLFAVVFLIARVSKDNDIRKSLTSISLTVRIPAAGSYVRVNWMEPRMSSGTLGVRDGEGCKDENGGFIGKQTTHLYTDKFYTRFGVLFLKNEHFFIAIIFPLSLSWSQDVIITLLSWVASNLHYHTLLTCYSL